MTRIWDFLVKAFALACLGAFLYVWLFVGIRHAYRKSGNEYAIAAFAIPPLAVYYIIDSKNYRAPVYPDYSALVLDSSYPNVRDTESTANLSKGNLYRRDIRILQRKTLNLMNAITKENESDEALLWKQIDEWVDSEKAEGAPDDVMRALITWMYSSSSVAYGYMHNPSKESELIQNAIQVNDGIDLTRELGARAKALKVSLRLQLLQVYLGSGDLRDSAIVLNEINAIILDLGLQQSPLAYQALYYSAILDSYSGNKRLAEKKLKVAEEFFRDFGEEGKEKIEDIKKIRKSL